MPLYNDSQSTWVDYYPKDFGNTIHYSLGTSTSICANPLAALKYH